MNKKTIWIFAECKDYYKLIYKLQYLNIFIYDINYSNNQIHLKINSNDFKRIKKYLISYNFKKESNTGIYSIIKKINDKKIFVSCILIGLIVFILLSNLVVKINIIHENKEIRELIKEELDEYGIKVLSFKKNYKELDKIRNEILDKYPDKLDWMEFEVNGMIINVKVEERIITDINKENKVCDLVAVKSGVINDILVTSGDILVNINDYVRKGDILATGIIKYNEEDKRYTCASGSVYATIWYTVSVSIPLNYYDYVETGDKKYNLIWENDGNKKKILKSRFENYNSKLHNIFHIFDFKLYLEEERETKKILKTYSEDEALEEGIKKAINSVKIKLNDNDEIIDKKVLKKTINDSKMDIEVFVIAKEVISAQKEVIIDHNNEEGID